MMPSPEKPMRAPLVLGPSVFALLISAGIFLALTAMGAWLCVADAGLLVLGLVLCVFGGGFVGFFLWLLWPSVAWLRLDEQGLTFRWAGRRGGYAWDDVERFSSTMHGKGLVVGIRLRPHHPRTTSVPMQGEFHDHIDGYRLGVHRLVALLESYREAPSAPDSGE
jgi:hypothetical protein